MKRLSFFLAIVLVLSCGAANAQLPGNTFIRLGTVTPTVGTDSITAGVIVSFPIIYGNRDTNSYNVSNAFVIFSDADGVAPTGVGPVRGTGTATWAHATGNGGNFQGFFPAVNGIWLDTTEYFPASEFPGVYEFGCFGCDGAVADTLSWSGAGGKRAGIPTKALRPKDSGVQFTMKILTKLSDHGKFICIDSSTNFPPSNKWKWPAFNYLPAYNTFPTWSGAKCFTVVDPVVLDVRETGDGSLPTKFELAQNYPNPFNPSTIIRFELPKKTHVTLTVYNVLGQAVKTLVNEVMPPKKDNFVTWNGDSQTGAKVSSGMYFYKLEADGFVSTKKMLLVK